MKIEREAIIEIVGTQYEGRAQNHSELFQQQKLLMKHQHNNLHDPNAVMLLTGDGKELGFLPKGYASLYAPAIDSGRYSFDAEVAQSEFDPERPILFVKITYDLKDFSEEKVEKHVLDLVQKIVNGYAKKQEEYFNFLSTETMDMETFFSVLNQARLLQKLHLYAGDIITNNGIVQNAEEITILTKEEFTEQLTDLKSNVNDMQKWFRRMSAEFVDIEDDEEYDRKQSELRRKRNLFRSYSDHIVSFLDAIESYVPVGVIQPGVQEVQNVEESTLQNESIPPVMTAEKQFTEKAFLDWLITDGNVFYEDARQHLTNIHNIENLYQKIYGHKKKILDVNSANGIKEMIEAVLQRNEFIDANERRNDSFRDSLRKFAEFADLYIAGLAETRSRKHQPPDSTLPYIAKTVDFESTQKFLYSKPSSFTFKKQKYLADNWRELYEKLLFLLYTDDAYSAIIKGLNGKALLGRRIDFADSTLKKELRRPIRVAPDFYAEGNLSAVDIVSHIKCLKKLCSIHNDDLVIEYTIQEKENEADSPESDTAVEETEEVSRFTPDTSKPFVLKDALIEILSSNAPEITKFHGNWGGISAKDLRDLLKTYYGKDIISFEISRLLMTDRTFRNVGRSCYVLDQAVIPHEEAKSEKLPEKDVPVEMTTEPVKTDEQPVFQEKKETPPEQIPVMETLPETGETEKIIVPNLDKQQEISTETGRIILNLCGNRIETYDCNDALNKVCEFAISCKPFRMARIAGQSMQIHGKNVFYRRAVPVDGYHTLSDGLQVISVTQLSDLQYITGEIKNYCQIQNELIEIIRY